mmetsp:Transcript_42560/g.110348  ORF Transcript_42560/g.110348 Transcript_42560/m.110348 type:complete len:393 (+) Transcript_42560:1020-2198(+)
MDVDPKGFGFGRLRRRRRRRDGCCRRGGLRRAAGGSELRDRRLDGRPDLLRILHLRNLAPRYERRSAQGAAARQRHRHRGGTGRRPRTLLDALQGLHTLSLQSLEALPHRRLAGPHRDSNPALNVIRPQCILDGAPLPLHVAQQAVHRLLKPGAQLVEQHLLRSAHAAADAGHHAVQLLLHAAHGAGRRGRPRGGGAHAPLLRLSGRRHPRQAFPHLPIAGRLLADQLLHEAETVAQGGRLAARAHLRGGLHPLQLHNHLLRRHRLRLRRKVVDGRPGLRLGVLLSVVGHLHWHARLGVGRHIRLGIWLCLREGLALLGDLQHAAAGLVRARAGRALLAHDAHEALAAGPPLHVAAGDGDVVGARGQQRRLVGGAVRAGGEQGGVVRGEVRA